MVGDPIEALSATKDRSALRASDISSFRMDRFDPSSGWSASSEVVQVEVDHGPNRVVAFLFGSTLIRRLSNNH